MPSIDLSCIKNNRKKGYINDVKNDVKKDVPDMSHNEPQTPPMPDFQKMFENLSHTKDKTKSDIQINNITKELTESEKNKIICLCNLYISEFPEKLAKYKTKKLQNLNDDELLDFKKQIQREVSESNMLSSLAEQSVKALQLYEYVMCDFVHLDIRGVSKVGESEEYKNLVKQVLLKYLDTSLISSIEPEYKLAFMIFSSSVLCHQNNTMNATNNKINNIEKPPIEPNAPLINDLVIRNINYKYNDL